MNLRNKHCGCRLCERHRQLKKLVRVGTRKQLGKAVMDLFNELGEESEDLSYHTRSLKAAKKFNKFKKVKAILDGSWPSSVEILTGVKS